MVLFKHEFSNGNIFIWLGKSSTWGKGQNEGGFDNVLILNGGEVLFLKTEKILQLYKENVKDDIKRMKYKNFVEKYRLPISDDLWKDLKKGVESEKYPPFLSKSQK